MKFDDMNDMQRRLNHEATILCAVCGAEGVAALLRECIDYIEERKRDSARLRRLASSARMEWGRKDKAGWTIELACIDSAREGLAVNDLRAAIDAIERGGS